MTIDAAPADKDEPALPSLPATVADPDAQREALGGVVRFWGEGLPGHEQGPVRTCTKASARATPIEPMLVQ